MDPQHARDLLLAKQAELQSLLGGVGTEQSEDHEAEGEQGDGTDPAQPLEAQGVDDAVAAGVRERLAAIDRAFARLDEGTYGTSVLSGDPIPDGRLEIDPAAELTVAEAAAQEGGSR